MLSDIKAEYQDIKSDSKTIRHFGILFFVVFTALALWLFYKENSWSYFFVPAGIFFLFSGIFFFRILIPFYKAWMLFGIIMGWFVSRLVLIFLFYIVFAPISLLLKILGKDILDQKIEKKKSSYWRKFQEPDDIEHYKKQF